MEKTDFEQTEDTRPLRPNRRNWLLGYAGAGLLALAGANAGMQDARAQDEPEPGDHPVEGAWRLQVAFQTAQNPSGKAGFIEQTLASFIRGGIMIESDGAGEKAHFGHWKTIGANQYAYHLVELNYDPASGYVSQIVVPNIEFEIDDNQLRSTSATTTLYIYNSRANDPNLGKLLQTIVIPSVSVVTGDRLTATWTPPAQLPVLAGSS